MECKDRAMVLLLQIGIESTSLAIRANVTTLEMIFLSLVWNV